MASLDEALNMDARVGHMKYAYPPLQPASTTLLGNWLTYHTGHRNATFLPPALDELLFGTTACAHCVHAVLYATWVMDVEEDEQDDTEDGGWGW